MNTTLGHNVFHRIPTTWCWATIGDVCTQPQYGYTTSAVQSGTIKLLRTTDITSGQINWHKVPFCLSNPAEPEKYLLKDGDIVISRAGSIGVSYLIKQPGYAVFASYLIRFHPLIDKTFFKYFLESPFYWQRISENKLGIAVLNINASKLSSIAVPIAPIAEQNRIVSKIEELFSELDKGIESLKSAQQQLKLYRQAVLKWAFEGNLTAKWRKEQKKKGTKLETAREFIMHLKANEKQEHCSLTLNSAQCEPFEIPSEWSWVNLDDLLESIEAGKSFRCDERPPKNNEIGVAKVSAVSWGEYDEYESKTCKDPSKINEQFYISSGDFLFSRANTIELVGACAIAKKVSLKVMLSDKTLRFRFPKLIDQRLILYFLRSKYGRSQIEYLSSGNQESMRNIGQNKIRTINIPLPGKAEQVKIIELIESCLSICDQFEATIEINLKQAKALRQSILQSAFEGKLVPQDPNDEPAGKLLERIRKERTGDKGKKLQPKNELVLQLSKV